MPDTKPPAPQTASKPPVRDVPGQKNPPHNAPSQTPPRPGQAPQTPPPPRPGQAPQAPRPGQPPQPAARGPQTPPNAPQGARLPQRSGEHVDPVLGTVEPLVRQTETLPVAANTDPRGEPVGHARHAETPEELEKIQAMEGFGSDRKVAPPGSRHYVAGQPVNDEEYEKTEAEANRLAEAGRAQRNEAEKRMAENNPDDPDYHPADIDKRDTDQALGRDPNKRGASDQPGETNPFPRGREEPQNNVDRAKNR